MYDLIVKNHRGVTYNLSSNFQNYEVAKIEGLSPPNATMYFNENAGFDGSYYANSALGNREIVVSLYINSEYGKDELYKVFAIKNKVDLTITDGTIYRYISGYIQSIEYGYYDLMPQMQVSIVCPNPYFKSEEKIVPIDYSATPLFTCPFSLTSAGSAFSTQLSTLTKTVTNNGNNSKLGFIAEIYFTGAVSTLTITNESTGKHFTVDNSSFSVTEPLIIDFIKGEKSVYQGIYPMHDFITNSSEWLYLDIGDNIITITADSGIDNVSAVLKIREEYQGV